MCGRCGKSEELGTPQPLELCLTQNHPNPFCTSTTIPFSIPGETGTMDHVRLIIRDISGRHVRTLVDAALGPGNHRAVWDELNDSGRQVPSGVYIYSIMSRGQVSCGRMILLD